jgi:hypothetical protein
MRGSAAINQLDIGFDGMLRIPGGAFRMGSDKHYPEEAPVHRVTVNAFHIDRTPVTNRQFTWQGEFPKQNLCTDGFDRTSPVTALPIDISTSHVGFRCITRDGSTP